MQLGLFGLLTALPALKGQYFPFDCWMQRPSHQVCSFAAVWADDRLNAQLLRRDGFFHRNGMKQCAR